MKYLRTLILGSLAAGMLFWCSVELWGQADDAPTNLNLRKDPELIGQAKTSPPPSPSDSNTPDFEPAEESSTQSTSSSVQSLSRGQALIGSLTIFVLAIFVGFEVITKVPPTLHTPLMSGSNAISGITLAGAVILAARGYGFSPLLALLAVALASVNAVGGFMVTHRMLAMFKKKR